MLRRATVGDAPAIGRVTAAGFEGYREFAPEGWQPPGDMIGGLAERLARPGAWGMVEERDGEIVGFAAFIPAYEIPDGPPIPDLAHVWAVFVSPHAQGTGVATALMDALIGEIAAQGFPEARLYVAEGQRRARAFYAREGWREVSDPVFVEALRLSVVEMRTGRPALRPQPPGDAA